MARFDSPRGGRFTRLAVFYDGAFFARVSAYYAFHHARRSRVSIAGLHRLLREALARREGDDAALVRVVASHYFRGRITAQEADERGNLLGERILDDVLQREGVVTHYQASASGAEGGIELGLALEALDLAARGEVDAVALVTGDGALAPLVRKLQGHGVRVLVPGWSFEFQGGDGVRRTTRTAQALLQEAAHALDMDALVESPGELGDALVDGLFVHPREEREERPAAEDDAPGSGAGATDDVDTGERATGTIEFLRDGFGFIDQDEEEGSIYFFHSDLEGAAFDELEVGQAVEYTAGRNDRGPCARKVCLLEDDDEDD